MAQIELYPTQGGKMIRLVLTVFAFAVLSGCTNLPNYHGSTVKNCEYTERDLTVAWGERLYWCEMR